MRDGHGSDVKIDQIGMSHSTVHQLAVQVKIVTGWRWYGWTTAEGKLTAIKSKTEPNFISNHQCITTLIQIFKMHSYRATKPINNPHGDEVVNRETNFQIWEIAIYTQLSPTDMSTAHLETVYRNCASKFTMNSTNNTSQRSIGMSTKLTKNLLQPPDGS